MGVYGYRQALSVLPPGKILDAHCVGGWVAPEAALDGCGKFHFHRDSIPGAPFP